MSQEQQDRAMDHEAELALHKGNLQRAGRGPRPVDQARLLDKVVDSELETTDEGLVNLRAKDFPLGNYDEEVDTFEFKWFSEILNIYSKARHPHPRSGLQGLSRAWATGDRNERLEALGLSEYSRDESYLLGTYSRATRGEGMAQQEASSKMITESHAVRESNDSKSKGGILGRFRS